MVNQQYVLGQNGVFYEFGYPLLNGLLLFHTSNRSRLFVLGGVLINGILYWETASQYPKDIAYFHVGSAVMTDIELDLCPQWKDKAIPIDGAYYMKLKENKKKNDTNFWCCWEENEWRHIKK